MKDDGKSAKGGSDQDDRQDFFGKLLEEATEVREKDQRTVLEEIFGLGGR